jgi:hypothetical protein
MTTVATAAPVAVDSLRTATERAHALGLPATLFGFTPEQKEYWHEPGLPWFTTDMYDNPPLGYNGLSTIPHFGNMAADNMAPRFPKGCSVNTRAVHEKKNLVVGRVYTYHYQDTQTGAWRREMGRLVKIGSNYLEVKADNCPTPSQWLLREDEQQAVWDVNEVTHYASYPGEDEREGGHCA